jgi:HEAT repeat protein
LLTVLSVLVPIVAAAQVPPAPPVAPPPMPAQAPQAPPAPPPAPARPGLVAPPVLAEPFLDSFVIQDALRAAQRVDAEAAREAARQAQADAREAMRMTSSTLDSMHFAMDIQDRLAMSTGQDGGSYYSMGLNAMQARQYDRAVTRFDQAIAQKGPRTDAALYWKAFSQYKLGQSAEGLATVAELRKSYGQSRYLNDARALEADLRKLSGQPVNIATMDNDDIKLLAIQAMQNVEPQRAIPLLESVLNSTNSLQVKKRALYVLALSDQPQAHQILFGYAKGNGNPDLQREAIAYLGSRRQQVTSPELKEIYDGTQDVDIKKSIIEAYRMTGDKMSLVRIATGSGDSSVNAIDLRKSAISGLTNIAAPQELWALYEKEQNRDLRMQMVRAFSSMGAVDQLTQVLKTEKDAGVRQQALRSLGNMKTEKTGSMLVEMYGSETDKDNRKAIISALGSQNNAEGLVAIARKETSLDLKTDIVRKLSDMAPHSKVAADYLMEVIK